MCTPAGPTPVTLVTGFLGAGKTTLLRHLLAGNHGRRLGVVVNDFGTLGIDAELIREVRGDTQTVRLTNGCICCTIREDLLETVAQLGAQPEPPEWVLLEASGVSDPHQIAATFGLAELAPVARLDGVVAVVDAEGYGSVPPASQGLVRRQVEAADLVLLNKRDLCTPGQRAAVRAQLEHQAPRARILECERCRVPFDVLIGLERGDTHPVGRQIHHRGHLGADHGNAFTSFVWECAAPLDAERLRDAIGSFPGSVLRGKGFVHTLQAPEEAGEFHLVGKRASLVRGGRWETIPRTRLVFIGECDPSAESAVRELLARCIGGG